ncbi:unnamed protein product [Caenorhabditis angaria]|uniref:K Homology domain-containing protein n=1 Tax=Caenorhabditis angaria TaxID=860376 RepID=A0A9P1I7W7_9PELO|nr:unnamed protein product [Caenorhabditis angaria]
MISTGVLAEKLGAINLTPPESEEKSETEASLFYNERKSVNSDNSILSPPPITTTLLKNQQSEFGGFSAPSPIFGSGDAPSSKRFTQYRDGQRQKILKISMCETLFVPVKKYPKYNFVGRILGPRGMTVKQLEKETGCKIYVRGRASNMAFNPHTKMLRGGVICNKSSLSTISQGSLTDEPLHVAIECYDYPGVVQKKMANAVAIIQELLSPPADGKDELKRQQLVDISLINGTYRPTSTGSASSRSKVVDPTLNPIDEKSAVYRIPQRRTWCKPRGPEGNPEEFAKSASSREYLMNIVNKTSQSGVGDGQNLSTNAVSERLKIANSLLESHQIISYGVDIDEPVQKPLQFLSPVQIPQQNYYQSPQYMQQYYSSPPPPPPPQNYPPIPPQPNQSAVYPLPGLVYMLPDGYNNNTDYEHFLQHPHHHRNY